MRDETDGAIYEYEQILLGNAVNFVWAFETGPNTSQSIKNAAAIWRYAITKILKWTPQDAVNNLTKQIVENLCLDRTLYSVGINQKKTYIIDYRFMLQHAFPDEIHYDVEKEAIAEWERSMHLGKWMNNKEPHRIPKSFFTANNGRDRANAILRHAVNLFLSSMSAKDMYMFFANSQNAKRWLTKKLLIKPCTLWYTSPLEYFHEAMDYPERSEFWKHTVDMAEMFDTLKARK